MYQGQKTVSIFTSLLVCLLFLPSAFAQNKASSLLIDKTPESQVLVLSAVTFACDSGTNYMSSFYSCVREARTELESMMNASEPKDVRKLLIKGCNVNVGYWYTQRYFQTACLERGYRFLEKYYPELRVQREKCLKTTLETRYVNKKNVLKKVTTVRLNDKTELNTKWCTNVKPFEDETKYDNDRVPPEAKTSLNENSAVCDQEMLGQVIRNCLSNTSNEVIPEKVTYTRDD